MQQLEEKGIPQPRLLVPAAALAVLAVILLVAVPALLPSDVTVKFTLQSAAGQPVPNAALTLLAGQKEFSATSDASGQVTFKGVPPNQKLQLRISASGYVAETKRIGYGDERVTLTALEQPPSEISFSAQVLTDQRMPVEAASVRFTTDDGDSQLGVTDTYGEAKARMSDTQRVSVEVSKDGYKSQRRSVILADQKTVEIVLEKSAEPTPTDVPPGTQSVLVSVSDEKGSPVRGVSVQLLDEQTQSVIRAGTTDASGESRLDRINPNQAFIVSVNDPKDRYYPYSSPYALVPGAEPVTIVLNAAPESDQLVITIKDKAGNAVSDATVTAYDPRRKSYLSSIDSDASGRAALTLDVAEAYVTVYHDGFNPVALSVRNKETRSVVLESSEGKTVAVRVTVQKNLEPAPEAQVQLYSADGFPLGLPSQYTAADGTASFDVPRSASAIHAKASLEASVGESDRAVPQADLEWVIHLLPPKVPFRVRVTDAVSQKPVNGATVRFVTHAEKLTCKTQEGACQADVPTETEFHLVVDSPAYLPYQSATQLVGPNEARVQYEAKLYPKSLTQSATVQFQGFFTPSGQLLRETANAQPVQARFLVSLPSATADDRGRFSVRLAESPAPVASITAVDGTDVFFTGSDPTTACNPPESDNNSEFGQWAVFEFSKGFSGTQQVSVDFLTTPDAKAPAALWIQYDLHGLRSGVPFVHPLDVEKLQQLTALSSVSESDFCGQKSASVRLPISRDVMTCQDQYCSKAVFVTSDGRRFTSSASLPAGQAFGLDLDLIGLQAGISQVQISAPSSVQLLSLQVVGSAADTLTQSNLESADAPNSVTVSLQAAKNEKVRLHLDARAVRASALAEISIQLDDADGGQATIVRNIVITGTNRFTVAPSSASLEAGLSENLRVTVKDQFNKPVTDASVELYECDGSPINGQAIPLVGGSGGAYSVKVQPSSIGTLGIRVSQPQFVTYEECVLPVRAVDFLVTEPESVLFKGDTQKETVTESITLSSLLDVKSKVTSTVKCTDANGTDAPAPFTLSPKSLTLKDTATVKLQSNLQAFKGRCDVTFVAKINKDNMAASLVSVDIELKGPPAAHQLCPTAQAGVKCLSASEATPLRCTKTSFLCEDTAQSCYQCNLGPQTLPGQISLSVSNYQSDATQTYAIALEDNPEECRVEGFTNNPSTAPYGYNNPYGTNPYGYSTGYSAPNSYYGYRPNTYTPYASNPYQTPGACMPYTGSYPYGSTYSPTYASAYPNGYAANNPYAGGAYSGTYPGGAVNPAYAGAYPGAYAGGAANPAYTGAYPGTYPATPGINPSNALANPSTPYANCQAIIAKLSPYCQPYFTQYSQYNTDQNYYGNSYRDPWSSTLNPTYPSPASFQYPQQRPTVNVQADCTRTELRVTAQYTGGDTNYGGALGGNQQGYLLVRTGGQTKQIPITVIVQTPFSPGAYPGTYPGGYYPGGYPTNQIPPQCILEYQQAVQTAYTTAATATEAGLDDSGLPDTIDVYYNTYTGQGTFERELKAPAGGVLSVVKPSSAQVRMDASGSKIRVSVQCKKTKEGAFECPDNVPFKATWTFANLQTVQKDRTIRVSQDDFVPSVLQLLATKDTKDAAMFDVSTSSDFTKAKCKGQSGVQCRPADGQISAQASAAIKDGKLEIRDMDDYQIRQIPVRASVIDSSVSLKAGEDKKIDFSGSLTVTPTCDVVNAEKSDVKSAVEVTCTKESVKIKAKEGVSGVQKGWIEFTFDDSERNYEKVTPSGFKPKVQLIVEPKDGAATTTAITLTPPATPAIVKQAFTIGFKFPVGDDPTARKITLTLVPDQGGDAQKQQWTVMASQLTVSAQGDGTTSASFDQPGRVIARADGKLGGKDILGTAEFNIVKAEGTSTAPPGPTTPGSAPITPGSGPAPSGPSSPGGGPATASGTLKLKSLAVSIGIDKTPADKNLKIEVSFTGDHSPWKAFNLFIFKDKNKKSYSGKFSGGHVATSGTSWSNFLYVYSDIKKFMEANGEATFVLAAYADEARTQSLGRVQTSVKASDLGFTASTAPSAPAPGTTASASKRCTGSGTYKTCWLSPVKAEYRCTDWLDNGFGLCILGTSVNPAKVDLSVSGGDGLCGGWEQSNFIGYHTGQFGGGYKKCGDIWSFKLLGTATFPGVGTVANVEIAQQKGGSSGKDLTSIPGNRCVISPDRHTVSCKLKPWVTSQRCTETTAQGAAVCVNWIDEAKGTVQLKTMTGNGRCWSVDHGLLSDTYVYTPSTAHMTVGKTQTCTQGTKYDVSVLAIADGYVTVTLIDQ